MATKYDIVISFDTTGSMSGCISMVKKNIEKIINELFEKVKGIRIGLVAHGDYCDEKTTYLMKQIDLTEDKAALCNFMKTVENTGGGDYPEAYEYMLREVQKLSWDSQNMRALVVIGDAPPHAKDDNPHNIDWRNEVKELKDMGVTIYSVQCLNNGNSLAKTFYKQMSSMTDGYHLYLDQFSSIIQMIMAICMNQQGKDHLEKYEQDMKTEVADLPISMRQMFDIMLKRKTTEVVEEENEKHYDWDDKPKKAKTDLSAVKEEDIVMKPCLPSRFQILKVTEDCDIKSFVKDNGVDFETGRGFYEFTKSEIIGKNKEIILRKKATGELFEGLKARKITNLMDYDDTKKVKHTENSEYDIFIQSTSVSRKLIKDTSFLYEIKDFAADKHVDKPDIKPVDKPTDIPVDKIIKKKLVKGKEKMIPVDKPDIKSVDKPDDKIIKKKLVKG